MKYISAKLCTAALMPAHYAHLLFLYWLTAKQNQLKKLFQGILKPGAVPHPGSMEIEVKS